MRLSAESAFRLLGDIVRISNSTLHIDERLVKILEELCSSLSLQSAALYILDSEKDRLNLKVSTGGDYRDVLSTSHPVEICIKDHRHFIFDSRCEEREFLLDISGSSATGGGGLFPVMDDRFFYGVLFIALEGGDDLSEEDVAVMQPVTLEIAGTIRNAQLYSNTKAMVDELLALNDIWKAMSSTLELDELLNITIHKAVTGLKSYCGMIKIFKEYGGTENVAYCNIPDNHRETLLEICKDTHASAIKKGEVIVYDHLEEEQKHKVADICCPAKSAITAPITLKNKDIGVITLLGREDGSKFGEQEIRMLSTIASQVSVAADHALLLDKTREINKENELMVRELSTLFELNKAVMTTMDLDKLFHIILTSITIGDGFGFNRAMLFLYNERTGFIQGMMGIGPDTAEEAWSVWSDIHEEELALKDFLEKEDFRLPSSKLDEMVKGLRTSVEEKSILQLTVKEERAFNIADARNDPRVNRELLSFLNCKAFATVPLMASGRVVGAVLVDNIFNNRLITDDDVRLLTIFANQAGVAIDNSILYRDLQRVNRELTEAQGKLVHSEKLAALGEMSAGVAHEIRNPLVSIGGFARRLSRKMEEGCEEGKYVDIICKEVERLENILNDILMFSKEEPAELELQDINALIDDTLQFFWSDFEKSAIEVHKELQEDLCKVEANYQQLKQVFINLLANAKHVMRDGGSLNIKSFEIDCEGEDFVAVEINDTGGGISHDIINNIFNPFFTTKDNGTGLGLAITHKIVSTYGGDIEVMNNERGGATFLIKMPVSKKAKTDKEVG